MSDMQNTKPHNLFSLTRLFPQTASMETIQEVQAAVRGHWKITLFDGTSFNAYDVEVAGKKRTGSFEVKALGVVRRGTKDGYVNIIPLEKIESVESRKVELDDEARARIAARRAERNRNR